MGPGRHAHHGRRGGWRLFLSDQALDFAFCAVAIRAVDGTPLSRYGHLRLFGASGKIVRSEYATIIQHPNGRQKHIASRNNRIDVYPYDDDLNDKEKAANNFLYYSTDTLKGSSGSPVFSDQWYVVALHRRGVPETASIKGQKVVLRTNQKPAAADDPDEVISYISNEGVRISRILERVVDLSKNALTPELRSAAARVRDAVADAAGQPTDGPFSRASATTVVLEDPDQTVRRGGVVESFEIGHRKIELFPENTGYDKNFLTGHAIPLPFRHFSTAMHARRRLPVFAAINLDGKKMPDGAMPDRPGWSFDPRIDQAHQPDDTIFSDMLSFTLTNVCPQIRRFNATVEWFKIAS